MPAATRPTMIDVEVEEDCNKTVTEKVVFILHVQWTRSLLTDS